MHFLVTGGAGFIGSHLVERLLADGHAVAVLDDFNDFYAPAIKHANLAAAREAGVTLHTADLRDADAVARVIGGGKFDAIVHLAARAGVRPSIQQPRLYVDTNVVGTLNVLEAARAAGVRRVVFASSSSVYGLCQESPFREDFALLQTISPYAATKLAGEHLCSNYAHLFAMRIVALRFFTVYGPRQRPDLAIHQFTRRIARGEPIQQFGDGSTRRDYTYIDDILQGVLGALDLVNAGDDPFFDIFNLGESATTPLRDLIRQIETALGKKARIEQLPEQPGDVPHTCADISKARAQLGYRPQTPLEAGIPRFVEWFLKTQAAVEKNAAASSSHGGEPARQENALATTAAAATTR
ncbi:MAG: SDR family NAD(P)-dependent oxidoreductase [Verrucomicrobia bacterium]|nr:SDR family NAD(P)-dependent oxidoreductase [Verrucomicrobiota bacterium]